MDSHDQLRAALHGRGAHVDVCARTAVSRPASTGRRIGISCCAWPRRRDASAFATCRSVLDHWRELPGSTAAAAFEKPALVEAQRRCDRGFVAPPRRNGPTASTTPGGGSTTPFRSRRRWCPLSFRPATAWTCCARASTRSGRAPRMSATKSSSSTTIRTSRDALAYLADLARKDAMRVVPYPQPFNYAAQCNLGVREARLALIALVNNDIEACDAAMARRTRRPGGAAQMWVSWAPRFLPGRNAAARRRHSRSPTASATGPGSARDAASRGPYSPARCARSERPHHRMRGRGSRSLPGGGRHERGAGGIMHDLDLCLRLRRAGYRNLLTPTPSSCTTSPRREDWRTTRPMRGSHAMKRPASPRSGGASSKTDPLYNPNLALQGAAYALALLRADAWRMSGPRAGTP